MHLDVKEEVLLIKDYQEENKIEKDVNIEYKNEEKNIKEIINKTDSNYNNDKEELENDKELDIKLIKEIKNDNVNLSAPNTSENANTLENNNLTIEEEVEKLETETIDLKFKRGQLNRYTNRPTTEMLLECQELLEVFGFPYITAPMEVINTKFN